jgi:hypothetical protein
MTSIPVFRSLVQTMAILFSSLVIPIVPKAISEKPGRTINRRRPACHAIRNQSIRCRLRAGDPSIIAVHQANYLFNKYI